MGLLSVYINFSDCSIRVCSPNTLTVLLEYINVTIKCTNYCILDLATGFQVLIQYH